MYVKKQYVILGITLDDLELPIKLFVNYKEMSAKLGKSVEHCHCMVSKNSIDMTNKCRYVKVNM